MLNQGMYISTTPSTKSTHLYADEDEDEDPLQTLSHHYMNLFSDADPFTDVVFIVDGKQVNAHRCILSSRSNYFRSVFYKHLAIEQSNSDAGSTMMDRIGARNVKPCLQIPVDIVGYDEFVILLRFLYSGKLVLSYNVQSHDEKGNHAHNKCFDKGCSHLYCSSLVGLALDTLHAANLFGLEQLSLLIQRRLVEIVDKISIDDVMRVLVASKQAHEPGLRRSELWQKCSGLVARSGLKVEILRKHLPGDVVLEIVGIRGSPATTPTAVKEPLLLHDDGTAAMTIRSGGLCIDATGPHRHHIEQACSGAAVARDHVQHTEEKVRKLRQALDCEDMELVRLMVMGEGLDLDDSQALHYAVASCSRGVVKGLLEMGAVDVNAARRGDGRTALHVACEMGSPDMICLLLDHHASPSIRSATGTPLDIISEMIVGGGASSPRRPPAHTLRLSLELLQSAAFVYDRSADEPDDRMSDGSAAHYHNHAHSTTQQHSACSSDNSENSYSPLINMQDQSEHHNNYYHYFCDDQPQNDYRMVSDRSPTANYLPVDSNLAVKYHMIHPNHSSSNYVDNPNYTSLMDSPHIDTTNHNSTIF